MAIYHLSAKLISRKAGRSATASAAYRAGEKIADGRTGEVHDYTKKRGVEHAEVVMPSGVDWTPDRAELWNAVEAKNKRADAQVAREFVVALPGELDAGQRRQLALGFARHIADTYQVAADVAIHFPGREGDHRNHHAHILTTTNTVQGRGLGNKARELDLVAHNMGGGVGTANAVDKLRQAWADMANHALERADRIDHRSLQAQGIERLPTQHMGPAVAGIVRRGASSEVARRMAEEANARLSAARETGRIERELDRSILDLSGDLADAIRAREERQREDERPPRGSTERTGPAVQSSRFKAKPTAAAERERERRDPVYRREKAERTVLTWDAAVKRETADVIKQIRADVLAKARLHVEQWQAHIDSKPLLFFGERARNWQKIDEEMGNQDRWNRRNLDEINEKGWPMNNDRRLVIQQAAEQAAAKNPELARQAKAAQNLIDEEKRRERERYIQEQARAELAREFRGLAAGRAMQAHGFTDGSRKWQATPELLREIIDDYNRRPKEQQERALAAWMRDPEKSVAIAALIEQRRENSRDRGMSR